MRVRVAGMHAAQAVRLLQAALGARGDAAETNDMEGVQDVLEGRADYFVGICATGAGGALAMAQLFAGPDRCRTVTAATAPAAARQALAEGVICFGVPADRLDATMRLLAEALPSGNAENR